MKKVKINKEIERFLTDNYLYSILNLSKKNNKASLFVDDETCPQAVVCYTNPRELYLYSKEKYLLDEIFEQFALNNEIEFCALDCSIYEYYQSKCKLVCDTTCGVIAYNGKPLNDFPCPYNVTTVKEKDYQIIVDNHQYGATLDDISHYVTKNLNSAVYVNDELACWVLMHDDGAMGPLYTLPKWRRNGFAQVVMVDLMKKIIDRKDLPFAYIVKGNTASEKLQTTICNDFLPLQVCWSYKEK